MGIAEKGTDVLPTENVASDANFLVGYYRNHGNRLLVGATIYKSLFHVLAILRQENTAD